MFYQPLGGKIKISVLEVNCGPLTFFFHSSTILKNKAFHKVNIKEILKYSPSPRMFHSPLPICSSHPDPQTAELSSDSKIQADTTGNTKINRMSFEPANSRPMVDGLILSYCSKKVTFQIAPFPQGRYSSKTEKGAIYQLS